VTGERAPGGATPGGATPGEAAGGAAARPLAGRVALVTGASSGIGAAIATRLCAAGADVVGIGRDKGRLTAVAEAATAAPGAGTFEPAQVDLTDDQARQSFLASLVSRHPALDVLVHSAGGYVNGSHETSSLTDLDALTQALIPPLRAARGDIVVINSSQGMNATGRTGQFAATQHAMRAVTDSLRQEVNDDGIRVCGIHLGRTATPRQEAIFAAEGRPYRPDLLVQPGDVAEVVLGVLTLGANAEITELRLRPARKSY
jgi:NADP-dependent 3-hydroxy acid dehydrogenase YdfG